MADYISKYTGAQIDLAVASGSTPSGHITASGNVNVGGNISSSGKLYLDDEIHLRDGNSSGDTLVKIYASGDDGIIDVYQDNSVVLKFNGGATGTATPMISSSGHIHAKSLFSSAGGFISASGKIYSHDEIHLLDGGPTGDLTFKAWSFNDDGMISVYRDGTEVFKVDGRIAQISASGALLIKDVAATGRVNCTGSGASGTGSFGRVEIVKNQTIGTGQTITAGGITLTGGQAVKGIESEIKRIGSNLQLHQSSSGIHVIPHGGARTLTLPHVASGSGCTFRITAGSAHQHIVTASNPAASNSLIYGHIMDNNNATSAAGAGGTVVAAADKITLNSNNQIGDSITIVGDGTNWYVSGLVKDAPTVS